MIGFEAIHDRNLMTQDRLTDLIAAARSDPAAFGKLYDHFIQPVYRYLYSRLGSVHEAEDITSQTFMAAYEALPKYREQGQFAAWLFRIARSKMNDHFRRGRFEVHLDAVAEKIPAGEDALNLVIQDEEMGRLQLILGNLNPEEQDLIRLRYVADLSFVEMADLLGKREDAVKKSVYRLLARLKSQME
jgi:RNA polymerase sigma-70 factor (ECF subfamily)